MYVIEKPKQFLKL